jgi:hypothetical protein
MRTVDGKPVHVGDIVKFDSGLTGCVVCSVDTSEFTEKYPESEWALYLVKGILVETKETGLVHLEENDVGLELVEGESK